MELAAIIGRLRANAAAIEALVEGMDRTQAGWKPAADQWSILEVVNHLADEEVEDFRTRLDFTLHRTATPWPPIDPPRWAVERAYASRDLGESLARFLAARADSIDWLEALQKPDWSSVYEHPKLGRIRAGDLLISWVGHDHIHIRQINRLHREYLVAELSTYSADYAGRW